MGHAMLSENPQALAAAVIDFIDHGSFGRIPVSWHCTALTATMLPAPA
jgi:hypothetical protein